MTRANPLVREALLSAAAAALVATLLVWLGPPGTDLAAHAYQRTLFLQHGFTLWNNFWYAGRYSFITYSLLYYPLAAFARIRLLAVATIALAALAFAVVLGREWGPTARWSSRSFAVVWAGIVLSAAFPFALGTAFALLAIWALQSGRRWRTVALAALTLAASPLAFLLLVVVLAGIALARRDALRRNWSPVAGVAAAALCEVVLWRLFPGGGRFPFSFAEAAAGVAFCVVGLVFTWRVESARVLRFVFARLPRGVCRVVSHPVGDRREHRRGCASPRSRSRCSSSRCATGGRSCPASSCSCSRSSWNVTPLAASYVKNGSDVTAQREHVARRDRVPARAPRRRRIASRRSTRRALAGRLSRRRGHPDRARLVPAGRLPAERGAVREARRRAAYLELAARARRAYVVLSDAPPDYSARGEARLLRSGRAGLTPCAAHGSRSTIFAVPHARPIITGPGHPRLSSLTGSRMSAVVHRGGTYRIAVRWQPVLARVERLPQRGQGRDAPPRDAAAADGRGSMFRVDATHALEHARGRTRRVHACQLER